MVLAHATKSVPASKLPNFCHMSTLAFCSTSSASCRRPSIPLKYPCNCPCAPVSAATNSACRSCGKLAGSEGFIHHCMSTPEGLTEDNEIFLQPYARTRSLRHYWLKRRSLANQHRGVDRYERFRSDRLLVKTN